METRANYVLIGLFSILTVLAGLIFVVWMANAGLDKQGTQYDVVFEGPVRGLEVGGEVRFNGIKVGEVVSLKLSEKDPKDVIARIRVQSATPVKVDSVAQLDPAGLTGQNYVQILAGSDSAALLQSKLGQGPAVISSQKSQFDRLFANGEGVLSSTLEAVARVNKLLDADNMENIAKTLQATSQAAVAFRDASVQAAAFGASAKRLTDQSTLTVTTYDALGKNLMAQTQTLGNESIALVSSSRLLVDGLTEDTNSLSGGAELTLAKTIESLAAAQVTLNEFNETAKSMRAATDQFGTLTTSTNRAVNSIDAFFKLGTEQTLPDLSRAAQEVRNTSMTYDALGQQVSRNPMEIFSKPPTATVEWKR